MSSSVAADWTMDKRSHTVVTNHTTKDRAATDAAVPLPSPQILGDVIARNEINLETWSFFLFPHSKTALLDQRRTHKIFDQKKNGTEVRSVEVTPLSGERSYTNRTYTTLLALILLWHDDKYKTEDGGFRLHLSDIAKKKCINHESGKNLRNIREDLYCLKTTTIDFRRTFIDQNGPDNSLENISILSTLKITKKSKSDSSKDSYFAGRFSEVIIDNLIRGCTNPKNLTSLLKINSERGQILYRYIDTKIYGKPTFEKTSLSLFKDLFGEGVLRYSWKSNRKYVLEKIVNSIDNSRLSSGNILRIRLADTADKKDIKIICTNTPTKKLPNHNIRPVINADETVINSIATDIQSVVNIQVEDAEWESWTKFLAAHYTENLTYRVIAEFKEVDVHGDVDIDDRRCYFTDLFHRLAHATGAEWVGKNCGKDCPKKQSR